MIRIQNARLENTIVRSVTFLIPIQFDTMNKIKRFV